jgi:hypothetical protein
MVATEQHRTVPRTAGVQARSPMVGILALAIALAFIAFMRIDALLSIWFTALQVGGPGVLTWIDWAETSELIIVVVLGVVAAITGRGRWYGLAAILVAGLGSSLLWQAILATFPPGPGPQ